MTFKNIPLKSKNKVTFSEQVTLIEYEYENENENEIICNFTEIKIKKEKEKEKKKFLDKLKLRFTLFLNKLKAIFI